MDPAAPTYPDLYETAFNFPAIDNHAHPLLRAEQREDVTFEGLISEAQGNALVEDAVHTLACYRATHQLSGLFGMKDATWAEIKTWRSQVDYLDLCKRCIDPTGIQCILLDDGLDDGSMAETIPWHDQFTHDFSRRIVRIEVMAERILDEVVRTFLEADNLPPFFVFEAFGKQLTENLTASARDPHVAGFKSIVCYRTGLDVAPGDAGPQPELLGAVLELSAQYQEKRRIRLINKIFNDHAVRIALEVAGNYHKPVQFHTGLGDNDINLLRSSPSHLQPIIEAYPQTTFVLLHSSYPYTRDAGYLTAVYSNVFLDFGEVFPLVSGHGQRSIIRQILELSPTNKIMWSTDAHWWPESYYLGTIQAREALYEVLSEVVGSQELSEAEAITIVENALFHNANRIYNLGLLPHGRNIS